MLDKLDIVPNVPGCYLMKNEMGIIIYVGKAKKLKNRLRSYFKGTHIGKTSRLVAEIVDFDFIVVGSEMEALVLENNLIKQYDPKYNILLRDDKTYPYIEFELSGDPRLSVVRNINRKKKKSYLYGPYPNVGAARGVVNLLNRIYPLRKCTTYNKRPCLYYHIGQCLGYCTNKNLDLFYVDEVIKFLKGDVSLVVEKLKNEMEIESSKLNFENALELKELLSFVDLLLVKQYVEIGDMIDRDVFGYYVHKDYICVLVFFIRGSKVIGKHDFIFDMIDTEFSEFESYVYKFYDKDIIKPKEILIPFDSLVLSESLGCIVPKKGVKKNIIDMVNDNAKVKLLEKFELINRDNEKTVLANLELRDILGLEKLDRIELFDNSNLFGNYNVSGMVVFIDGRPAKDEYRKFKISIDKNDDYGTMREVIYRRYFRVLMDGLVVPDLIIVDGGVGQINICREVIASLNLKIMVVGLKKNEKHSTDCLIAFDDMREIKIDKRSNLFYYLERMQDEVHNFTINYHKSLRSKGSLSSILDSIDGIGAKRRDILLKKYKSINKLKELSLKDLENLLPNNIAKKLFDFLKEYE